MKITANRLSDIRRQRDEWESDYKERESRYEEQSNSYREARDEVLDAVGERIEQGLSRFTLSEFHVRADQTFSDRIEVRVSCNEGSLFDKEKALSWSYNVVLDNDGNVKKETSSWSGLQATTPQQLDSLRETLEALEYLNSIDWMDYLNVTLPDYREYVTDRMPSRRDRPNFEAMEKEAVVEELVGTNTGIHGKALENTGFRGKGYYVIVGETPRRYKVKFIPDYYLGDDAAVSRMLSYDPIQLNKDNLLKVIDINNTYEF